MAKFTFFLILAVIVALSIFKPQSVAALGTISVAILAIWGDWVREKLGIRPKLELSLYNRQGKFVPFDDGNEAIFYHLRIKNTRSWVPAKRVRVLITEISKKVADGTFRTEPLILPIQLRWVYPDFHELLPTIVNDDTTDFGFLKQNENQFKLALYRDPANFQGIIGANETMRVTLITTADNFTSETRFTVEITWDGQWSPDLNEMSRHLMIKEVPEMPDEKNAKEKKKGE